jgi:glycolate oxidase FAD binding subunit
VLRASSKRWLQVVQRMSDASAALAASETREGSSPVDGKSPTRLIEPVDETALREALAAETSGGRAVIVSGTGSRLHVGNVPKTYDTALSTLALDRIVAHEPEDMTITVQCGARVELVQAALSTHRQFLPLDPAGEPGTIGGLLATNASGPLRHRYGTARDWLLGLRVAHADGTSSKSGGRVVKNVSGYDLHKVHVGALGTLGVITEATFKVAPLPRVDETLAVACPSGMAAASIVAACSERGLAVIAAEILSPSTAHVLGLGATWVALLRLGGGSAAVRRTQRDIHEFAGLAKAEVTSEAADVWTSWRHCFAAADLALRVSVPPSSTADAAEAFDRRFSGDACRISGSPASGLLQIMLSTSTSAAPIALLQEATRMAAARKGFLRVDQAPASLKNEIDVFGATRGDLDIMRRLKHEFDPAGMLAPGRFLGRI